MQSLLPDWRRPLPSDEELRNGQRLKRPTAGKSPIMRLRVRGKEYFAKHPMNDVTKQFSPADFNVELAANKISHLMGMPNIPLIDVVADSDKEDSDVWCPQGFRSIATRF